MALLAGTDGRRFAVTPAQLLQQIGDVPRVVFDLDGTIYDTRDFERPALAAVAAWLREVSSQPLEGLVQALWQRRETDRHKPGLFDDLLARYGLPQSWGAECARRFHDYPAPELEQAQSLRRQLGELRAAQIRLALVSNGYERLQQRKLTLLGLRDMFEVCIFCDPRRPQQLKPAPWAWSQLARSSAPALRGRRSGRRGFCARRRGSLRQVLFQELCVWRLTDAPSDPSTRRT